MRGLGLPFSFVYRLTFVVLGLRTTRSSKEASRLHRGRHVGAELDPADKGLRAAPLRARRAAGWPR